MIVAQKRNLLQQILQNEENEYSESDRVFYSGLVDWFDEHGFWTIKQEFHVDKAIATHSKHSAESFNETQIEKPSDLTFHATKITTLFTSTSGKIKYPSIHFWRKLGELQFYLCGSLSKTPGVIRITNGQKYPNQEIYGEIYKDGKGLFRKDTSALFKKEIQSICEEPIEEAKMRGINIGYCCFCATPIVTKESLAVGYGPICAANWNLPWGEIREELVKI